MASLLLEVRSIFNDVQDGQIILPKLFQRMAKLQSVTTEKGFFDAFIHHVKKTMVNYKSNPSVERVMDFIAGFATFASHDRGDMVCDNGSYDEFGNQSLDVMEPFLLSIFNYAVTHHNARDKSFRLRCCQLVNKLLNLLPDNAFIDEDLSDALYECMMIRIKDRYPSIRIQSILALVRLQDPTDEQCPVINAYINSMETDLNWLVRKTALTNIAVSKKTLPYLIGRVRDKVDRNRKAVYLVLSEKVSMRALTIAQRILVLTNGLKFDTSKDVNKACQSLLKWWFRSCGHNFIKLLEALDIENSVECADLVMEAIFKEAEIEKMEEYVKQFLALVDGNMKMVDQNSLTPENTFFWYSLCKRLMTLGNDGEVMLQQILPELTNFCDYIRCYSERFFIDSALVSLFEGMEKPEFILDRLLSLVGLLDMSDRIGRQNLKLLVHDLLVSVTIPMKVILVLVERYQDVERRDIELIQFFTDIISDIKQPLCRVVSTAMKERGKKIEYQLARVSLSLMECKDDLEIAIKEQNFQQAALLKDHIDMLQKEKEELTSSLIECQGQLEDHPVHQADPEIMLKCLVIATTMLGVVMKRGISPILMFLKDELFFEGIKDDDPVIRNEAVKGLGLLSYLDKEFASQHLILFLQVAQVDQELVQITAVQVIFDLFLIYGLTVFRDENTGGNVEALDDDEADITLTEATIMPESPMDTNITSENMNGSDVTNDKNVDPNFKEKECNEEKDVTDKAESIIKILLTFIQSESSDMRSTVAEGFAKVMYSGRVVCVDVLKRLILLWYNPINEDHLKLQHCLGVFFPAFAFDSRKNQELFEQAFLPVIKTLLNAPDHSPLSTINIFNVIDLFIQLTDVRNLAKSSGKKAYVSRCIDSYETYVHDSIAMKVTNEILSDPEHPDLKIYCKILTKLNICPKNYIGIKDLMELSQQMVTELKHNRFALRMVKIFIEKLKLLTHEKGIEIQNEINGNAISELDPWNGQSIESTGKTLPALTIEKEQGDISLPGKHSIEIHHEIISENSSSKLNSQNGESVDTTKKSAPTFAVENNPLEFSPFENYGPSIKRKCTIADSPPPKMARLSSSSGSSIDFQIER